MYAYICISVRCVFIHIFIFTFIWVCAQMCRLSVLVWVWICTHVHTVYASVYKCIFVRVCWGCVQLSVSLPFAPSSPESCWIWMRQSRVEEHCHPFIFRLPWIPQRRKRRGKTKSKEERKRAWLFQLEARGRPFSTKEKTRRVQRQVLFSGMDTCYILCQQLCLYITSLNPHNPGGGYCYYLIQGPLWSSTRQSYKIQIGCSWLHLESCRDRKCSVPTAQPQAFLICKSSHRGPHRIQNYSLAHPGNSPGTGKRDHNRWELPDLEAPMSQIL